MSYCLWPTGMAKVIGDLIWSGVAARYPKLKFVMTEFETGWIAQFLQRLDWSIHRVPASVIPAEVVENGTFYWKQNFTATFEDDRIGLMTREEIGVNNLMWGSDFPHHDSTFPHSQDVLDDIFDGIPDEDRFCITVANCVELYKLPIEY